MIIIETVYEKLKYKDKCTITIKKYICLMYIIFLLSSCQMFRQGDVKGIIQEWQDKEILIPDNPEYKISGRDTLCSDLWNKPYKVFTYIDSIGCTGCQLGLPEWKALIDSCSQQQIDIVFLFAIHSSDFSRFTWDVRMNDFDYPIIYDYRNSFNKLNHFPPAPYRTFLLDKENKVVLVGSPIHNPKIWELYKKTITPSK